MELRDKMRQILLEDWDPIGRKNFPEKARQKTIDEYDSYLASIEKLLQDGADESEIRDFLKASESKDMGVQRASTYSERAAAKIIKIARGR